MSTKAPTLTDIRNLITAVQTAQVANHAEVQNRLGAVEEQVRLTNGRVKALETAEAVAKGIKEYQEAQTSSNPKVEWNKWVWIAVALAAALIAIGQALGGVVK